MLCFRNIIETRIYLEVIDDADEIVERGVLVQSVRLEQLQVLVDHALLDRHLGLQLRQTRQSLHRTAR